MKRFFYIIVAGLLVLFVNGSSKPSITKDERAQKSFRLFFYNTENFFDTFDDPKTNDNEFLPNSKRHWTLQRYQQKVNNIYKVIISLDIQPPAIVGLCEVENDHVLTDLTQKTPLQKFLYKFIHHDSPDLRGIDVAVLYRPEQYRPLKNSFIRIYFPFDSHRQTREILYTKGIACDKDTLHIFVNHWPSRVSGQSKSEPYRDFVAKTLRQKVDSIMKSSPKSKIIILGDFNDNPDDYSILKVLNAQQYSGKPVNTYLYDLSFDWLKNIVQLGTIKYKGTWSVFDQVIVSGNLLDNNSKQLKYKPNSAKIDNAPFLLKDDERYGGQEPYKTYNGYKYMGGFSDHLPVYFDLILTK